MSNIKRRLPTILKPVWNNVNYAVPANANAAVPFPAAAGMPAKKETNIAALDFSVLRLKGEKLSLDGALHRTYISIHENGTDASAMLLGGVLSSGKKYVYLNRPFVYMIVDCKEKFPVFIGTVTEI